MWETGWRDRVWSELSNPWDLVVIGGGITGAGIFREAARVGLRVLLVEGQDFASGTSSRSSKLVHGGMRYLKNFQFKVTYESVRERERLLEEARGLVNPLGFLMTSYASDPLPVWMFAIALTVYDTLALKWGHRYYDRYDLRELCPFLCEEGLKGGYRYFDAQTDDARLVLRVLQAGKRDGGLALNYAYATELLRSQSGQVSGVIVQDRSPEGNGRTHEVQARAVINASGAWADDFRRQLGGRSRLRRLRGSHLVLPAQRLPLTRAVSLWHPRDGRPVFAFPWEGVVLVGTTDVDHRLDMQEEPSISAAEADYLLEAIQWAFPCQELSLEDVQATFSGVRPVIDTGKADPSKESREHVLWWEEGLLTVAGGKLTTFRRMAIDALRLVGKRLPDLALKMSDDKQNQQVLDDLPEEAQAAQIAGFASDVRQASRLRLLGRFGAEALKVVTECLPEEKERIGDTPALWSELRWAARTEAVVHLEDLLLRRVRIGLTLPQGGLPWMDRIRAIAQPELGWDDRRWQNEVLHYTQLWNQCYYLP